jgi:hypothetical protein
MTKLEILKRAACSDGNCIFKITPEMRKGMHTNGGCHSANEASTDYDKKSGIRVLSEIARESLAKITELKEQTEKMKCCMNCKHFNWNDTDSTADCKKECLNNSAWEIDQ